MRAILLDQLYFQFFFFLMLLRTDDNLCFHVNLFLSLVVNFKKPRHNYEMLLL